MATTNDFEIRNGNPMHVYVDVPQDIYFNYRNGRLYQGGRQMSQTKVDELFTSQPTLKPKYEAIIASVPPATNGLTVTSRPVPKSSSVQRIQQPAKPVPLSTTTKTKQLNSQVIKQYKPGLLEAIISVVLLILLFIGVKMAGGTTLNAIICLAVLFVLLAVLWTGLSSVQELRSESRFESETTTSGPE